MHSRVPRAYDRIRCTRRNASRARGRRHTHCATRDDGRVIHAHTRPPQRTARARQFSDRPEQKQQRAKKHQVTQAFLRSYTSRVFDDRAYVLTGLRFDMSSLVAYMSSSTLSSNALTYVLQIPASGEGDSRSLGRRGSCLRGIAERFPDHRHRNLKASEEHIQSRASDCFITG